MNNTRRKQKQRRIMILIATCLILISSSFAISKLEITGNVTPEQEAAIEDIVDKTKVEVEDLRQEFAEMEADEIHASAPEEPKGFLRRILDEIARWFGMSE